MSKKPKPKLKAIGDRACAEHFPQGARLRWPAPPSVRIGSYGVDIAPSATGTVTMVISEARFVRFDLANGKDSQPVEVVRGQPCEAA